VIDRRTFLGVVAGGLVVAQSAAEAQPAAPIRRVGWLSFASEATGVHLFVALRQGMQELGWQEGKNVEYLFAYADGDVERLDGLARKLLGNGAEVIVVASQQTASAAQRATKTVPIVMGGTSNAVGAGFVASLAKPGGNITGFTSQQEDVLGKLIGILHEVAPGARRIAILLNESGPSHAVFWAGAQSACAAMGLVAQRVVASAPVQFGGAVAEIVRLRSQAIVVVSDPMFYSDRVKLQELLQTTRLPVAYTLREHVVAGGLLSYGGDLAATLRSAAKFVDKILKGAKPADLPVEQTSKFGLVINAKTTKALGLTIPPSLLVRADEVIQ
jgi:putative ABC transport system substrate-binding protein